MTRRATCRLAAVGLAALLGPTLAQAADGGDVLAAGPLRWQFSAGTQRSAWEEFMPDGKRLLRERGWLSGASGGVQAPILLGDRRLGALALELGHWRGTRDYEGATSFGTPVETSTGVRRTTLALRGEAALMPGWSATAELQPNRLHRDLRSTANALGYPEDWRWTLARIGVQWQSQGAQRSDDAGTAGLSGHAAWGRAFASRVRLQLPGRDAATLEPGTGPAWQAGARWGTELGAWSGARWSALAAIDWERITLGASAPVPLYANGVLVGAAMQPRTRMTSTQLTVGAQARW